MQQLSRPTFRAVDELKFAPWEMLRIGRRRVLEFLRDPEYDDYLCRLEG